MSRSGSSSLRCPFGASPCFRWSRWVSHPPLRARRTSCSSKSHNVPSLLYFGLMTNNPWLPSGVYLSLVLDLSLGPLRSAECPRRGGDLSWPRPRREAFPCCEALLSCAHVPPGLCAITKVPRSLVSVTPVFHAGPWLLLRLYDDLPQY